MTWSALAFELRATPGELRDRGDEWLEVALLLREPGHGSAPIRVLHRVAVARALLAPLPGAAVGEAHGHERGAQIVSPNANSVLRTVKQLGAVDRGTLEIGAELRREVIDVQPRSFLVGEDIVFRLRFRPMALIPDLQCFEHVGSHVP